MQSLKDQVQELHRDLTRHHALIKAEIMGGILHKSLQVDVQIASEYASVEGMRAVFQEVALLKQPTSPMFLRSAYTWVTPRQKGEEDLGLVPLKPLCGRLRCCLEPNELASGCPMTAQLEVGNAAKGNSKSWPHTTSHLLSLSDLGGILPAGG